MIQRNYHKYIWTGHEHPHLDVLHVYQYDHVFLGCYGGNSTAGAKKNEDAAFVLTAKNSEWTFAAICDAHNSSESALLMMDFFEQHTEAIIAHLEKPSSEAFIDLESFILSELLSDSFMEKCKATQGKTAVLMCVQKGTFLWWLSVGDNLIYLLHPQLANIGQYALNQRHFYEWIGQVNSLALPIPAYSRGVSELRKGMNTIVLFTDGVLEFEDSPFMDNHVLYQAFHSEQAEDTNQKQVLLEVLEKVHKGLVQDSATVISFSVDVGDYTGAIPSNQ